MSRILTVGAAQLGPIQRAEGRPAVVERMRGMRRVPPSPELAVRKEEAACVERVRDRSRKQRAGA